jgi:hypothetical protein
MGVAKALRLDELTNAATLVSIIDKIIDIRYLWARVEKMATCRPFGDVLKEERVINLRSSWLILLRSQVERGVSP